MGLCVKISILIVAIIAGYVGVKINDMLKIPPLPVLEDTWWGPGKQGKIDTSISEFKVNVPDEILTDLKQRLNNVLPFAPPLEGVNQDYGMNTNLLKQIVEFWKTKYDWREREKFLNKYPQFTTNIQGLKIHYLHVKPSSTPAGIKVLPLLLLHGWPGSVREFYEIIPHLTTPRKGYNFVFEVIAPSLPGYGFSDGASKPGLGATQMGVVFKNLMKRLGFEKYYLQGGDWGAMITSVMSVLYPDKILGVHQNMCFVNSPLANLKLILASFYPRLIVDEEHEKLIYPLTTFYSNVLLETGYMHIQVTKPDTVGVALRESPVGLAAYILEKFTTWTNPEWKNKADGGLTQKFTYTQLLDNVMIYWVTRSITTSIRLYSETMNKAQLSLNMDSFPIEVPSACARFIYDLAYQPDALLKERYHKLVHSADYEGGHFAAFEAPELLAKDIYVSVENMIKSTVSA